MNYRHVYMLIIEHAKSEMELGLRPKNVNDKKRYDTYFEMHHILPKSLFPLWSKRKSNIVSLTAREHFFCHQLLEKIYDNRKMFLALWRLANDGQNNYCVKNSRDYQRLKEQYKIYKMSDETKNKIREARKFQDMSWRKDWHPDECSRKKMRESHLGMKWWNNGVISTQSLEKPGDNWVEGRLYEPSKTTKEKLRNANLGKKQSDETKRKRSQTLKTLRAKGLVKQYYWVCQESLEKRTAKEWKLLGFNVYKRFSKGLHFYKVME